MADQGKELFRLPIEATKGTVVVTEPQTQVYLVTFTSGPDNRLLTSFCEALHLALDIIEAKYAPGVVITTSGIPKFYSNGLDLEHAVSTPNYFVGTLYALWKRLLTYPMPTVALINGHAFAGGAMTAMMHDYRIMNPAKGYICLNEVELGAPLKLPMGSIFRQKLSATTYRSLVLEAARVKSTDALTLSIVDGLGALPETLKYIESHKLVAKAQPGMSGRAVYRALKQGMWKETIAYLDGVGDEGESLMKPSPAEQNEIAMVKAKVAKWEGKAKL